MPAVEIDLELPFAGWQVMAVMHWPLDHQLARNNFLVTVAADAMQHIQDKLPGRVDRMLPDIAARVAAMSGVPIDTALAMVEAQASQTSVDGAVAAIIAEIDGGLFRPSGGYGRVAAAAGIDAIAKEADGTGRTFGAACGVILTYVVRLATHHRDIPASINRATHILVNRAREEGRKIPAEVTRKTMWWLSAVSRHFGRPVHFVKRPRRLAGHLT